MFTVDLADCEFNRERKLLKLNSVFTHGGFPQHFDVHSKTTNKTVRFNIDVQAGIDNEFWDGVQAEYTPAEEVDTVNKLVIYHA
jgi:hypothetical protein